MVEPEIEKDISAKLAELGYRNVNWEMLSDAIRVHNGSTPLQRSHLHPKAVDMCETFDVVVKETTGIEMVTVPVGYCMVNWILNEALDPTHVRNRLPTDVDVLGIINASTGSISNHADTVKGLETALAKVKGIPFCIANEPVANSLSINPFDFNMFSDPFMSAGNGFENIFLPSLINRLRKVKRYDQIHGASHLNPVFHNLKYKFTKALIERANEIEESNPSINAQMIDYFSYPATFTFADSLDKLCSAPIPLVSPLKLKHIERSLPSDVKDLVEHVKKLFNILKVYRMQLEWP